MINMIDNFKNVLKRIKTDDLNMFKTWGSPAIDSFV